MKRWSSTLAAVYIHLRDDEFSARKRMTRLIPRKCWFDGIGRSISLGTDKLSDADFSELMSSIKTKKL
jgi:hypothetical protein